MARRKVKEVVDADGVVHTTTESDDDAQPKAVERSKERVASDKAIDKLLDGAQKFFDKEFGVGGTQRLSAAETFSRVDTWVSTGSIVVDKVLAGGRPEPCSLIPFGRQTELSGLPGSGKTSLCAQLAAMVQAMGGIVVVTDTEERIDHPYWARLGVDTGRIINLIGRTLEDVFTNQIKFIQWVLAKAPNQPVLMLWDSLGGTTIDSLQDEIEDGGDIQEAAKKIMMQKAKIISNNMELINPLVARAKIAYVYTNTLYMDHTVKYGDPWKTPGGEKKNFMATVRLRIKRIGEISDKNEALNKKIIHGHKVVVKSVKNSMAPHLLEIEGAVMGNRGFCNEWTVKDIGERMGFISTTGSWTTWRFTDVEGGPEVKFQGWSGFLDAVEAHPAEYDALLKIITAAM